MVDGRLDMWWRMDGKRESKSRKDEDGAVAQQGLYRKYQVTRTDGVGVGRCIVLELDDERTWPALLTWANTVEADGNIQLATDVRRWVITAQNIATGFGRVE